MQITKRKLKITPLQEKILHVLSVEDGLSSTRIADALEHDLRDTKSPSRAIGGAMAYLHKMGKVTGTKKGQFALWHLAKTDEYGQLIQSENSNYQNGSGAIYTVAPANSLLHRVQLSDKEKEREGRKVAVYTSPQEFEEVVKLELKLKNVEDWHGHLVSGNIRICTGPGIPDWSPYQETNYGVSAYRVTFKDSSYEEHKVSTKYPFTVAPED